MRRRGGRHRRRGRDRVRGRLGAGGDGLRVRLLERGGLCAGASGANGALIWPQGMARNIALELTLATARGGLPGRSARSWDRHRVPPDRRHGRDRDEAQWEQMAATSRASAAVGLHAELLDGAEARRPSRSSRRKCAAPSSPSTAARSIRSGSRSATPGRRAPAAPRSTPGTEVRAPPAPRRPHRRGAARRRGTWRPTRRPRRRLVERARWRATAGVRVR